MKTPSKSLLLPAGIAIGSLLTVASVVGQAPPPNQLVSPNGQFIVDVQDDGITLSGGGASLRLANGGIQIDTAQAITINSAAGFALTTAQDTTVTSAAAVRLSSAQDTAISSTAAIISERMRPMFSPRLANSSSESGICPVNRTRTPLSGVRCNAFALSRMISVACAPGDNAS